MIFFMFVDSDLQLRRVREPGAEPAPDYVKRGQKVMEDMRCDLCSSLRSFLQQYLYILREAVLHFYKLSYLNCGTMSITDMRVIG